MQFALVTSYLSKLRLLTLLQPHTRKLLWLWPMPLEISMKAVVGIEQSAVQQPLWPRRPLFEGANGHGSQNSFLAQALRN